MRLRAHIIESFRQLVHSKLRSFLAVLGILVGTASVVAMVSIGLLAENQILSQYKQLGINLLSVSLYSNSSSESANPDANLSMKKVQAMKQKVSNITEVAPYIVTYGGMVYNGNNLEGSAVGVTPSILPIAKLQLNKGRFISLLDYQDYYCVLGYQLAQQTNVPFSKLIGSQIRVGSTIFTIAGILAKWPNNFFFNADFNNALLIPISTALAIQKGAAINNLAVRITNTDLEEQSSKAIKAYVTKNTINQQVNVHSPQSLIASMQQSSDTMTLLLGLIGSISLIVGGIGVMNIMLVSVTERQREIGIRLAIGARQRDIQLQFLIEAVILSLFGGISGMLLGVIATYFVSLYSHWAFTIFILPPTIGCLVSVLIGIFFGFYPAYKASKLDPIQTLRSD